MPWKVQHPTVGTVFGTRKEYHAYLKLYACLRHIELDLVNDHHSLLHYVCAGCKHNDSDTAPGEFVAKISRATKIARISRVRVCRCGVQLEGDSEFVELGPEQLEGKVYASREILTINANHLFSRSGGPLKSGCGEITYRCKGCAVGMLRVQLTEGRTAGRKRTYVAPCTVRQAVACVSTCSNYLAADENEKSAECPICYTDKKMYLRLRCCNQIICRNCLQQQLLIRPPHLQSTTNWREHYVSHVIEFNPVSPITDNQHYSCGWCRARWTRETKFEECGRTKRLEEAFSVAIGFVRDNAVLEGSEAYLQQKRNEYAIERQGNNPIWEGESAAVEVINVDDDEVQFVGVGN